MATAFPPIAIGAGLEKYCDPKNQKNAKNKKATALSVASAPPPIAIGAGLEKILKTKKR